MRQLLIVTNWPWQGYQYSSCCRWGVVMNGIDRGLTYMMLMVLLVSLMQCDNIVPIMWNWLRLVRISTKKKLMMQF